MAKRKHKAPASSRTALQAARVAVGPPAAERELSGGILDTSEWRRSFGNNAEAAALSVDAFYACVRLISDGVASASWGEWRGLDRLPDSRLVRRPMARMTRRMWTWQVVATMAIYNACPLRLVGGEDSEGVPWSLVPLMPAALIRDGSEYVYGTERISVDMIRWVLRASFPSVSPQLASILSLARDQLAAAAAAAEYVDDWWASGGAPLVLITLDQDLTVPQGEDIADRWLARRAKGPAYPAVLGKGATAAPFGASMATSDANAAQDRLLASIARYLGVPASYVNVPSFAGSLTYQNVEQAGLDLVRYTFSAYADPIGDAISDLLPGDYLTGRAVRLDLSHLTRGGQLDRYQAYQVGIAAGFLTRDEVRQAEGLPPLTAAQQDELQPPPPPELAPAPVEVPA